MTRDEWNRWFADFRQRLPETAGYIAGLPQETRDAWFDGIFAPHDIDDALAMSLKLMTDGEGIGRFDRDKLPSLFIRTLAEIRYTREQRKSGRTRRPDHIGAMNAVRGDAVMGAALRHVTTLIRKHKQEHGTMPSDELISQWTSDYLDQHDTSDIDPWSGPRYACHHCRDSGLQSYTSQGRTFCGACPKCKRGTERNEQEWPRSKRRIGYAPTDAEDNPFNAALAGGTHGQ